MPRTDRTRRIGSHAGGIGRTVRRARIDRRTTETQIDLRLALDGKGRYDVSTGIRFLDHMLELVARHGLLDLTLKATGDLDVDQHHTVEDVGIALGEAVAKALGARRGINRAGYFVMPMDETLGVAAIDLKRPRPCRRRPQAPGAKGRRPAVRAHPGLLRGIRAGCPRQRTPQGAVRSVESSPGRGRVQGVRPSTPGGVLT